MEIATSESGYMGYKKPSLFVIKGNTVKKVASFTSNDDLELFIQALRDQFMVETRDRKGK